MGKFKVWQVGEKIPLKAAESNVGLEKNLEDWIVADPSLLPGDLEIISRQMIVEGGRLDLMAMDPLGRFVVIEIKAGALFTDVVSQGMYYAAQIDKYPIESLANKIQNFPALEKKDLKSMLRNRAVDEKDFDKNKEILIYLVGTHNTPGMDTMLDFMAKKYHLPLTVVTFDVFQLDSGEKILVREIMEADIPVTQTRKETQKATFTEENISKGADKKGVGQEFRFILQSAKQLGLYRRLYSHSIMYTHPDHKNRMLFTVWNNRKPVLIWIAYEPFVEYYPLTTEQVAEALGPAGRRNLDMEGAQQLVSGLEKLLSIAAS